jgi:hypothetical protein
MAIGDFVISSVAAIWTATRARGFAQAGAIESWRKKRSGEDGRLRYFCADSSELPTVYQNVGNDSSTKFNICGSIKLTQRTTKMAIARAISRNVKPDMATPGEPRTEVLFEIYVAS